MSEQEVRWLTPSQQVIWRNWLNACARINEQLNADLRPHNLDLNEYEVLVVLSESPGHSIRMSQLAEGSNQSRSRLTHTVNRMEAEGLIVRETAAHDRRGVIARLTDKGFELLKTEALLVQLQAQHGGQLLRLEISSAEPLGRMRSWKAARPLVQWSWQR